VNFKLSFKNRQTTILYLLADFLRLRFTRFKNA